VEITSDGWEEARPNIEVVLLCRKRRSVVSQMFRPASVNRLNIES
jgi:hypothetical protein